MSKISEDKLTLKGSPLTGKTGPFGPENPQPFFKQPDLELACGPNFPNDKKYSYGRETGFRLLPYTMLDRYKRELVDVEFPSVVMENDFLKAVFVPALGGRLWSLYDKKTDRDILYSNPIFRPANLAIRDAWFSGGIEWNIGRLGHSVFTCSPVFAGLLAQDPGTGEDPKQTILRLWEFERQTRLFWRIEFSLPEGSNALFAYTRIENPGNEAKPLYWWTNTAVPQTPGVRVLSGTDEVIYVVPDFAAPGVKAGTKTMDCGRLPNLPVLPGRDASYPSLSDYSNEYFFQNDRASSCSLPWEAAVYEDGYAFGEISTRPLLYRKMFCWGSGRGGKRWQDFLSLPEEPSTSQEGAASEKRVSRVDYLELQAGLAPTQLHSADISGGESLDWVQAFTTFQAEPGQAFQKDYRAAASYVADRLSKGIRSAEIEAALEAARRRANRETKIICMGSGWGALEGLLHKRPAPQGLSFPMESIGEEETPWAGLLRYGSLPPRLPEAGPGSFVVEEAWETPLLASPPSESDWLSPYHLGVISFERGDDQKAITHWKESIKRKENPWAYRNLALAALKAGEVTAALSYYKRALELPGSDDQSFAEEYIHLLLNAGKEDEAKVELETFMQGQGGIEALSSPLLEAAALIALNRGDDGLLDRIFTIEQPHIREGKNTMVGIWAEREIRRLCSSGAQRAEAEKLVQKALTEGSLLPPKEIDFRMFAS